jgi:hypothetical protein
VPKVPICLHDGHRRDKLPAAAFCGAPTGTCSSIMGMDSTPGIRKPVWCRLLVNIVRATRDACRVFRALVFHRGRGYSHHSRKRGPGLQNPQPPHCCKAVASGVHAAGAVQSSIRTWRAARFEVQPYRLGPVDRNLFPDLAYPVPCSQLCCYPKSCPATPPGVRKGAHNSAVECHLHTVEVVGSNPAAPTISKLLEINRFQA